MKETIPGLIASHVDTKMKLKMEEYKKYVAVQPIKRTPPQTLSDAEKMQQLMWGQGTTLGNPSTAPNNWGYVPPSTQGIYEQMLNQFKPVKSEFEVILDQIFSLAEKEQFLLDMGYELQSKDYVTVITRRLADGTVKVITNTVPDLFLKEVTVKFKNLLMAKATLKLKL